MAIDLISLQFALFFKNVVVRPDVTFAGLNAQLMNLFDGIPTILPLPPQAPPEVPVTTLRSENAAYVCNIARARIDLVFQRTGPEQSNDALFKDFNSKVPAFSRHVLDQVEVTRFGLIARYFSNNEYSPAALKSKYFTNSIGDVAELGLRYNARSKFEGWQINDLVEINSGIDAVIGGAVQKGILIQRDINNVATSKPITFSDLEKMSGHYAKSVSEESIRKLLP